MQQRYLRLWCRWSSIATIASLSRLWYSWGRFFETGPHWSCISFIRLTYRVIPLRSNLFFLFWSWWVIPISFFTFPIWLFWGRIFCWTFFVIWLTWSYRNNLYCISMINNNMIYLIHVLLYYAQPFTSFDVSTSFFLVSSGAAGATRSSSDVIIWSPRCFTFEATMFHIYIDQHLNI